MLSEIVPFESLSAVCASSCGAGRFYPRSGSPLPANEVRYGLGEEQRREIGASPLERANWGGLM